MKSLFLTIFWNSQLHKLIAKTAEGFLNKKAKAKIDDILVPLGHNSIAEIADWADKIRGTIKNPDQDTIQFLQDFPNQVHKSWHYVNLPIEASSYDPIQYKEFTREDDVVHMINRSVLVLLGKEAIFSKLNALRWIVHLVGDVHQPLHVGCGYIDESVKLAKLVFDPKIIIEKDLKSDQGGNKLDLPAPIRHNLHSYWDDKLKNGRDFNTNDLQLELEENVNKILLIIKDQNVQPSNVLELPPERLPEQWATETLKAAKVAYQSLEICDVNDDKTTFKISWDGKEAYDKRCIPIIEKQIALASQNLAVLLNKILSGE
jgi:hypothetical protein